MGISGGGGAGSLVTEFDTWPITAETVLAFLDTFINGGNMPSAATPCGLPTSRALHLVAHLPPPQFLQFLKVLLYDDRMGILSFIVPNVLAL